MTPRILAALKTLPILTILSISPISPVSAQQMMVAGGEQRPIALPDGRIALIGPHDNGSVVAQLLGDLRADSERVNLAVDDVVVRFMGMNRPSPPQMMERFMALDVGASVEMVVVRGDGEHLVVTFAKSEQMIAPAGGPRMMMVTSDDDEGAATFEQEAGGGGGWVTAEEEAAANEFVVAGFHVVEGDDGPFVEFVTSNRANSLIPLEVGDIITAVNDRPVTDLASLREAYTWVNQGATATFQIIRDSQRQSVSFRRPQ